MSSFSTEKTLEFHVAAEEGDLQLVKTLSVDPLVNLNWQDGDFGWTAFHFACLKGHAAVVRHLLDFKERPIDYNTSEYYGKTPFNDACWCGEGEVVEMLVGDERIDVNLPDKKDQTVLWWASFHGNIKVVKWLLASGKHIDALRRDKEHGKTAGEMAESFQREEVASLLQAFEKDPQAVRSQLQRELYEPRAGDLFALVVFLSDGYLKLPAEEAQTNPETRWAEARRFFSLALRLPLELQMVLCNRVFGLRASIIKTTSSELGFRKFAIGC